ncbi:hypothetical protein T440DRAFT_467573 [Plenodomus tracheiphilus IPT5]|uniref:Uncharacterized protein n=1 Tax=Plenodomus tracheiphilus IPT5 TaxID=1408161 RepID=A0A6A7BCA6_9PLEO|nr:hypothetical protein T440DRAFT_467573 [Plenodomus tracheiphilus IPT5]
MVAEPHCVRSPDSTHARILSIAMVKIIIATLQGISPLCSVIGSLTNTLDSANFKGVASVDTIFFPLAILGLLRLCAAPWLTDDYQFSQQATQDKDLVSSTPLGHKGLDHINREMDLMIGPNNCDPFLLMQRTTTSRFKSPQSSWPSRMFRTSYLLVFGGIWTMSFLNMIPISFAGIVLSYTSTSFLTCLFYLFFLTVSIATFAVYFVRSQTTSTVLPCISSWWYRAYTLIVFTFMLTLVIVASTETNRGVDRLHSAEVPDVNPTCAELGSVWSFSYSRPGFGSATPSDWTGVVGYRITQDDQASTVDEYRLVDFIGYATGREGSPTVVSGTSNFSQSD